MTDVTQEYLIRTYAYDPQDGKFRHRGQTANRITPWSVAGFVNEKGYRVIKVKGKAYKAHRLAWMYVYGEWPNGQIDHINGDKEDNRIANLRIVTDSENRQNCIKPQSNNQSGYRGVKIDPRPGRVKRFDATIKINGQKIYLGTFLTAEEAYEAYLAAKVKLHIRGVV